MKNNAVEISGLALTFDGRRILDDISFCVPVGARVSLTGPSGSGKSSILRAVMGFIQPTAGEIFVEGEEVDASSIWRLRGRLAFVQQEPDLGEGRVAEILQKPFSYKINSNIEYDSGRSESLFDELLLQRSLLEKDAATLSGGEKQRVAIVSAILLNRDIYLLDEVTSALDAESKKAVADFFRRANNITVLSVSHDRNGVFFPDNNIEIC